MADFLQKDNTTPPIIVAHHYCTTSSDIEERERISLLIQLKMSSENEHIVMLPFMAQGHLIPFLTLAKQIHQRTNFIITIANTPRNIQYLRSTINSSSSDSQANIRLAELPFNSSDHNLPPDTENTEALPLIEVATLGHASTSLQAPVHRLLSKITEEEGRPPLCIISDVFLGWAGDVAKSIGTVNITFTTGGAYGTAAYVSIWQNLPHRATDSDEFSLPGFPDTHRFQRSQFHPYLRAADGNDAWSRFFQRQISLSMNSYGWLCNTAEEIEPLGLKILRNYIKLPVWTIGPLLPAAMLDRNLSSQIRSGAAFGQKRAGREPGISPEKCIEWLDSHPKSSVLYISFGSQNTISPSQMMELALGLELSEKPFIWAIRPPVGFDINGEFRADLWLPKGFEERISKMSRGLLVQKWAPQLEILTHESTGAFLSHCGWNSVIESLSRGVPIIGWPLAAEQAYNSKMLVEAMGVGVELTRGFQGPLMAEDVKKVVELVMEKEGKGSDMKKKAIQIGEQIRASLKEEEEGSQKGSSLEAMDNFVANILSLRH